MKKREMKQILKLTIACLTLLVFINLQAQGKKPKTNIIFIFADDWGYGDLSCHGSSFVKTPNIDKMANEGIDFTNFTVNSPVCSPSRTAVMTGQFPARQCIHQHFQGVKAHVKRGMPDWLDVTGMSLPRELQKAGYVTGHFGKWHLGSDKGMPTEDQYGFDEYATFNGSGTIEIPKAGSIGVDYAEAFIKKHKDQPFFINLWLHEAHLNHYPQERFMKQFSYLNEQEQVYASIIAEGDEAVGRILNLIKQLNLDDNTLVVFSTDNGPEWEGTRDEKEKGDGYGKFYSVGKTGGLKGQKRSLFAGGVQVPFVVRWPGHAPEGKVDKTSVITAVDLLPTFFEIAGVDVPKDYLLDGESVLDAFEGEEFERTKPIFWEWKGGTSKEYTWPTLGVRYGDWKLVVDVTREKKELYNVANDWAEKKDLAKSNPEKLEELTQMVEEWKSSLPTEPRKNCLSPLRNKK
jgi:N-acetylgalactosamine-6-sulfatase